MRKIVYLFFVLLTINNLTFTMDEKPLKNKKIQEFEAECPNLDAEDLQDIVEININPNKFLQKNTNRSDWQGILVNSDNLSRPFNVPLKYNDPTELLIYTEKLKILLRQLKKNNK